MIETEQQRRWWFATHPEYSRSRTGHRGREHGGKGEISERVSAEEVDRYVDRELKLAAGTLADFLKIVKKWFGKEGEERDARQRTGSGWDTEAGGKTGRGGPPRRGGGLRGALELFRRLQDCRFIR